MSSSLSMPPRNRRIVSPPLHSEAGLPKRANPRLSIPGEGDTQSDLQVTNANPRK